MRVTVKRAAQKRVTFRKRLTVPLLPVVVGIFLVMFLLASGGSAREIKRVSTDSYGAQANAGSFDPSISNDGRFVAFESSSSNLVPGDTNATDDIFVNDTQTGVTKIVSTNAGGVQGNSWSQNASISADGRYIAFDSWATNLIAGDTGGHMDVFLKDTQTGSITMLSTDSAGAQGWDSSFDPAISADGRYVAFWSYASNLVPGDTNGADDVFLKDTLTGITYRISTGSGGLQGNGNSREPSISADGRYIAFYSYASNLVSGDTNSQPDIYVKDRQTGVLTRISTNSSGEQGNSNSLWSSISADGRYVAFTSSASNLVTGDTNGLGDVFLKDTQSGITTRISVTAEGGQGNNGSEHPSISGNGRYIAFNSAANLVSGDYNGTWDVFVKDTQTGAVAITSTNSSGNLGNSASWYPSIAYDGMYVAFESLASNLVPNDTNSTSDVFFSTVEFPPPPDTTPPTIGNVLPTGTIYTSSSTISADYSDTGGSGINIASANLTLDGTSLNGCTSTETNISCPVAGLAYGTYTIGGSVSDKAGNTTPISGSFIVGDNYAPVVSNVTPSGTIYASSVTISADYSDSGSGINTASTSLTLDGAPLSGCTATETNISCPVSSLASGPHTIDGSVADNAGNSATASGAFDVVLNTSPVVSAGADQFAYEGDSVALAPATFTDEGGTHTATIDWGDSTPQAAGTVDEVLKTVSGSHVYIDNGSYTVSVCVTDDGGATGCDTFMSTTNNRGPMVVYNSSRLTVSAGVTVSFDSGTDRTIGYYMFTDDGAGDTHTATIDWGDGSPVEPGTVSSSGTVGRSYVFGTVVGSHVYSITGTYTFNTCVTDDDGATGCASGQITVESPPDTTPPVLMLPGDQTVWASGPAGTVVNFSATAVDAVDGPVPVTCSPSSGSTFTIGTTPVNCSATDAAGNTGTASFNVTVVDTTAPDTTPPALFLPPDITTGAISAQGAIVNWVAYANDAVDGPVPVNCNPASGALFHIGLTLVECSATDTKGNVARGFFQVRVLDVPPPPPPVISPHGGYSTDSFTVKTDYCLICHDVHNAAGDYVLMREATVTAVGGTCHVVYGESTGSEPAWTEPPCPGTPDNAGADGYSSGCAATLNNANTYPEASVSPTSAYENLTPVSGHRLGNIKDDPDYIPASISTLKVIRSEDYDEGEIYDHNPASSLSATGGLYCASCHTPHGSLSTVSLADGTAIPMPTATYNTSGAVTGYFFSGDQVVEATNSSIRAPAQWLLSSNPNHMSERVSGFSASYTEAGTGNVYNISGMAPVNPAKGRDEFCIRCHDKQWNGTDFEGHGFGEGTSDLANHPPLCMSCHGPRGSASTGWLSAGDFPHTSMNYKILSKDSDALCLGCHSSGRLP